MHTIWHPTPFVPDPEMWFDRIGMTFFFSLSSKNIGALIPSGYE
jgi:hypothetical protein